MKRGVWVAVLTGMAMLASAEGPVALDTFLDGPAPLWERPRGAWLEGAAAPLFRGVTDAPNGDLRYPGYSNSPELTLLGSKVYEAVLSYGPGVLTGVTVSFYNRGDAGEIAETNFLARLATVEEALTTRFGQKGTARPSRELVGNVRVTARTWTSPDTVAELSWASSARAVTGRAPVDPRSPETKGYRAEYIQLKLVPVKQGRAATGSGLQPAGVMAGSAASVKKNVRKGDDGFVYVDGLPMVDQGERGYCVVATAERLLRYYGKNVDQHVLAQMADTRTGGGTSPDVMFDMLRRTGLKFGVKAREYETLTVKSFLDMVEKYNAEAKKKGKPPVKLSREEGLRVDEIYAEMDVGTLRGARCERGQFAFNAFFEDVMKSVDQGVPLAWSVVLGLIPEKDIPQSAGFHMRIIHGYNKATRELLYTDSWGAGHERKVMAAADAWTITTGLYALDPRY